MSVSNSHSLYKIVHSVEKRIPEFASVTSGSYFSKRLQAREENGQITLALSLAFLQDMVHPVENLDERVLAAILDSREENDLLASLTDVSVNLLSWKQGDGKA